MSVRVMTLVWSLDLPDSDKLVLLALADCANDEGHCWPSVASLVRKCSKSERTIQGSIKRLVDEGHLIRREVPGKGCNYTVLPRSSCAPAKNAPPQGAASTPAAAADKPSRTTSSEAKASSDRVIAHWNFVAKANGFHKAEVLDASRRQTIRLRIKEHGEDRLKLAFDRLAGSSWMKGEGRDSKWKPDLDFALRPATLRKALEGAYGEDEKPERRTWNEDEQRASQLHTADLYERMGRVDEAHEIRRRWNAPEQGVGAVALKLVAGLR